jgi:hypothetical protein
VLRRELNFRFWHFSDIPAHQPNVRYRGVKLTLTQLERNPAAIALAKRLFLRLDKMPLKIEAYIA